MKNVLMILPMAALAAASFAQEAAKPADGARAPLTAEQKAELRRERRERRLAESGGIVERDVQGGSALIVTPAIVIIPSGCSAPPSSPFRLQLISSFFRGRVSVR